MFIMKHKFHELPIRTTLVLLFAVFLGRTISAQSIQVEFVASNVSWTNSEYTGHAFMCIILPTGSGPKEDCYGFYPRNSGIKGFIGGPGVVQSEFQKKPSRFSRITTSIRKNSISEDQRRAILKLVNDWNNKNYDLTNQSCIDFVAAVAKEINWEVPSREATELPETYLNKLKYANELKPAIPGIWQGETDMNGRKFPCKIDFRIINNELKGQFIYTQDDSRGMCDNLQVKLDRSVSFSVGDGQSKMNFSGNLAANLKSITGSFTSQFGNGTWYVNKQ